MFDILQFLTERRKSSSESFWMSLTEKNMNAKTVKMIAIQTGCLLMTVRGKHSREAIHVHLLFSYLEIITPPVLAFERSLTMGNGFIDVTRSCHAMKTWSFSHIEILKKSSRGPLVKLGPNAAKYFPSRLRGKS